MIGCDPADEAVLGRWSASSRSRCRTMPNADRRRGSATASQPTQTSVDEAARHIAAFSIAGIHAVAGLPRKPVDRHGGATSRPTRRVKNGLIEGPPAFAGAPADRRDSDSEADRVKRDPPMPSRRRTMRYLSGVTRDARRSAS